MIHIKVPATTANIGPGFDTLGLAFNLFHQISVKKIKASLSVVLWPETNSAMSDADNYVIHGIEAVFKKYEAGPISYELSMLNCHIPPSRGLGSSAAAYVSGVIAGLYLLDLPLDKEIILKIASDLEGHPDNVAPAIFGGMVAACMVADLVIHQPVVLPKPIQFIALIPDFQMSTQDARDALPLQYSKKEAIFNLSRLSILLTAFQNGRYDLLRYGTEDQLHQPYRLPLMPDSEQLLKISSHEKVLGGFVSGAGSTYMVMCDPMDSPSVTAFAVETLKNSKFKWQVLPLDIQNSGTLWEVTE